MTQKDTKEDHQKPEEEKGGVFEYLYNLVYFVMICFFLSAMLSIIWTLGHYREVQQSTYKTQWENTSTTYPYLSDLWKSCVAAFILYTLETPFKKLIWRFFYDNCKDKTDEMSRIFMTEKAS